MTAAFTGRAPARGPMPPRTLACTADGIWLWPGTPLTEKRGVALVPIPAPHLYQHVATLHGPAVHPVALARMIERATACLNRGRLEEADQILAAVPLPPVSFDGAALMQAIGRRLGVSVPDVEIAGWPSASPPALFDQLVRVDDRKLAVALALEPVFNPDLQRIAPANVPFDPVLHPRWPAGQPDGGQFRPRDGNGIVPVQWQGTAARVAARLLARLWRLLRRLPKQPEPDSPPPRSESVPEPTPTQPPANAPESTEEKPPGVGQNRPPEDRSVSPRGLDQPFTLPIERPTGEGEVAQWGQRAADAIRDALANNDTKRLIEIADALAHADWIKEQLDNIIAAQDPPRSLDELTEAAQEKGRRFGYDNHHIIEQGPQNGDLSRDVIEAPYNIVRIPRYKHWQINDYYRNEQKECDGLTPREYLKGKSLKERYQFGPRRPAKIWSFAMTTRQYSAMSNEQLAEAFVEISVKEADAMGLRDSRAVNKLIKQLRAIEETLRARGPEARKILAPLLRYSTRASPFFADQTAQVRLNAAKELLAVVPDQARATLEHLAAHGPSAQSGSAGMCLLFLDDGVFKPT